MPIIRDNELVEVTLGDDYHAAGVYRAHGDFDPQQIALQANIPLNPAGHMGPFLRHLCDMGFLTQEVSVSLNLDPNCGDRPIVTVYRQDQA